MNKNKATHSGHCQACGSLQKLPEGRLSKHRYSVEWSCFVGICPGSKHLPIEQDYSLVQRFIASAQESLAQAETYFAKLNQPAAEPRGWSYEFIPAKYYGDKSRYIWIQRDVLAVDHYPRYADYVITHIYILDGNGRRNPSIERNGITAEIVATRMNREYAARVVGPEIAHLRSYIKWQQDRIADWAPEPLVPVQPK